MASRRQIRVSRHSVLRTMQRQLQFLRGSAPCWTQTSGNLPTWKSLGSCQTMRRSLLQRRGMEQGLPQAQTLQRKRLRFVPHLPFTCSRVPGYVRPPRFTWHYSQTCPITSQSTLGGKVGGHLRPFSVYWWLAFAPSV